MNGPVAVAIRISATDRLQLAQAIVSFQSLLALDHAWTGLIEQEGPLSEGDQAVAAALAGRLISGLSDAQQGVTWLHDFVLRIGASDLGDALRNVPHVSPDVDEEDIHDLYEEYSDRIGSLVQSGRDTFNEELPGQIQRLAEDLEGVFREGAAQGDLFKGILCSISAVTIVAGLVSAVFPPYVHGIPIVTAGSMAFKCFGCKL